MHNETMKQALEALEDFNEQSKPPRSIPLPAEIDTAMDALRAAIDAAEKQEPVASDAYNMIDRFLRNNLDDADYAEYSAFLDSIYTYPAPAVPSMKSLLQAIARGWCHERNAHKEMDSDLAEAIAKEVFAINPAPTQPDSEQAKIGCIGHDGECCKDREQVYLDAARYRWLVANSFDRTGITQFHVWQHEWFPHSQSGIPIEWKNRVRWTAIDATIDAAMKVSADKTGEGS